MTLRRLLVQQVREIYYAEQQQMYALPRLARAADHPEVREALLAHLDETREHVTRLEDVFALLDEPLKGQASEAVQTMADACARFGDGHDADILAAAARADHWEIGAYRTAVAWARAIGLEGIAELLQDSLDEETWSERTLEELAARTAPAEVPAALVARPRGPAKDVYERL